MLILAVFLVELILLFFLSGMFIKSLYAIIFKLTGSKTVSVYLLFIILLPGVLIHELSHYLTAKILFVPAGDINLNPEFSEGGLRLGSVKIGKTDFIRNLVIGLSPLVCGVSIIIGVFLYLLHIDRSQNISYSQILIFIFIVFEVINTMFSSRKDLEGAWKFMVFAILAAILFYSMRFPVLDILYWFYTSNKIMDFLRMSSILLVIPIGMDLLLVMISKILLKIP